MRGTTGKKYGTRAPKPTYTLLLQLVCVCVCVCVFSFFPCVLSYFSHVRLFVTLWTISPPVPSFHGDSPHGNTEAVCHAFFQRIFPAQGLNPVSLLSPVFFGGQVTPPGKPLFPQLFNIFKFMGESKILIQTYLAPFGFLKILVLQ